MTVRKGGLMKRMNYRCAAALLVTLVLCLSSCSAPAENVAATAEPTPGKTLAMGRTTPMPTIEHVTPAPLVTPRPTPTPEPTPDPTPLPTLFYSGTGDDVIELNMDDYPVIHFTSEDENGFVSITGYDDNGEHSSLLISEVGSYDGVVTDFGFDIRMLQIKAHGQWNMEAYTYEDVPSVSDEYEGSGDYVLSLDPTKRIAEISGNENESFFAVTCLYYDDKLKTDLLIAATDPYSGKNMLHGIPLILQIKASGPWKVKLS